MFGEKKLGSGYIHNIILIKILYILFNSLIQNAFILIRKFGKLSPPARPTIQKKLESPKKESATKTEKNNTSTYEKIKATMFLKFHSINSSQVNLVM